MATVFIHPAKMHTNILSLANTFGDRYSYVPTPSGLVVMLRNPKFKQPKGFIF